MNQMVPLKPTRYVACLWGSTGVRRVGVIGLGLESPAVGTGMPALSATAAGMLVAARLERALSGVVPLLVVPKWPPQHFRCHVSHPWQRPNWSHARAATASGHGCSGTVRLKLAKPSRHGALACR